MSTNEAEESHNADAVNERLTRYLRFRPFIKFELTEETDKKAQCSVAFHKSLKNVLLKVRNTLCDRTLNIISTEWTNRPSLTLIRFSQ